MANPLQQSHLRRFCPLLAGTVAAAVIACWVLTKKPSDLNTAIQSTSTDLLIHTLPVSVKLYGLERPVLTEHQLQQAALAVKPIFRQQHIPIGLAYHALRLWGRGATFSDTVADQPRRGTLSGEVLFKILTNE